MWYIRWPQTPWSRVWLHSWNLLRCPKELLFVLIVSIHKKNSVSSELLNIYLTMYLIHNPLYVSIHFLFKTTTFQNRKNAFVIIWLSSRQQNLSICLSFQVSWGLERNFLDHCWPFALMLHQNSASETPGPSNKLAEPGDIRWTQRLHLAS